jgi:hypothetical protein
VTSKTTSKPQQPRRLPSGFYFKWHFRNQWLPLIKMSYRLPYLENFHFSNLLAASEAGCWKFEKWNRYLLLISVDILQVKILKRKLLHSAGYTGGPRISWFLVPNGNHEMRGSWIPRIVFSVKPQNGSKSFLKSTFWALFSWNFDFSPIEIAAFSSLLLHAYWISCNCYS